MFSTSVYLSISNASSTEDRKFNSNNLHSAFTDPYCRLWLLGVGIFITSNILGSFVQIASLPVVILAPLGAVSLLFNALFAMLLLGDIFSPLLILGTVLIGGGAVMIGIFGVVPEQTRSLEDLLALWGRRAFVAYFSILGVVVAVWLIAVSLTPISCALVRGSWIG